MKPEIPFRTSTDSMADWERPLEYLEEKKPPITGGKVKNLLKKLFPKTSLKPKELRKVVENEKEH